MDAQPLPRSVYRLNLTQFLGALNDNLLKLLSIFFLISLKGQGQATVVTATAGAVFVIPFLLFSPLAGSLSDRFSKARIIRALKAAEVGIALAALAAFRAGNATALYGVIFLMASHSALFGPAKYGILPELVEPKELGRANGLVEVFTWLAIILGSALAPALAQLSGFRYERAALACLVLALGGALAAKGVKDSDKVHPCDGPAPSRMILKVLRGDRELLGALLGSAFFLFFGAFVQIILIPLGMEVHGLSQEQSGYLFLAAGLGIGAGSWIAGRLSARNVEFGIIPPAALGMALGCCGFAWLPTLLPVHLGLILITGLCGGLFIVPLHTFIQQRAPRQSLGRILALGSLLSWTGALCASVLTSLLSGSFGFGPVRCLLVLGLLSLVPALLSLRKLADFLLRLLAQCLIGLFYRLRIQGLEQLPVEGAALLVANHVSYVDALVLAATNRRRVRFVMHRDIYNLPLVRPLCRRLGVLPISSKDSIARKQEFFEAARKALAEGYMVCIFAEGSITRTGALQPFRGGLETIARSSSAPIIPIHLGGLWGSIFSFAQGRPLRRIPPKLPRPVSIRIGSHLPSDATAEEVRRAILDLGREFYGEDGKEKACEC